MRKSHLALDPARSQRFSTAYFAALNQAQRAPNAAASWFAVALAANLTNRSAPALKAYLRARACDDFTDLLDGDFHRDFAIHAIRRGKLQQAMLHLSEILRLHVVPFLDTDGIASAATFFSALAELDMTAYANRCFAGLGVMGRFEQAAGRPQQAFEFHAIADAGWRRYAVLADQQWQYDNLIHWLLAAKCIQQKTWVAHEGVIDQTFSQDETIKLLHRLIKEGCPVGSKNRRREVTLMRVPYIGPMLYRLASFARPWFLRLQ